MTKLQFPKNSLVIFVMTIAITVIALVPISAIAQTQTVGLFLNDTSSFEGYTIFVTGRSAVMIDNYGRFVHSWEFDYVPGWSVYLLENGLLLWTANTSAVGERGVHILKSDWNGNVVWEWKDTSSVYVQHHDIEPLPNGNVLVLAQEFIPIAEVVAAGRDTANFIFDTLLPEIIFEVEPTGTYQRKHCLAVAQLGSPDTGFRFIKGKLWSS